MYAPVYILMNSDMFMAILMENSPKKPETKKTKKFSELCRHYTDITYRRRTLSTYPRAPACSRAVRRKQGNMAWS